MLRPDHYRYPTSPQAGFTLIELLVTITVVVILFGAFATFFVNTINNYADYQYTGTNFSELAAQSQRISSVLRGLTDIVSESSNDLSVYAYFAPSDMYVSLVHYYLNASGTALLADVTPMTANPPIGTLITNSKTTYTIISHYYRAAGTQLFTYYDTSGTPLTFPIADEHSILEIQVTLGEPVAHYSNGQNLSVEVSLRNRKTNL